MATNNVRVLPGCTGIISLALKLSKTSFVPCHTITGKGIAYVKPLDPTLPGDRSRFNLRITDVV